MTALDTDIREYDLCCRCSGSDALRHRRHSFVFSLPLVPERCRDRIARIDYLRQLDFVVTGVLNDQTARIQYTVEATGSAVKHAKLVAVGVADAVTASNP